MSKMTSNTPRPSSSASKKAQRTSRGGRFLGALMRVPYRKFSGSHPPSSFISKGLAFSFLALLAALAVGLLVMLPGGPVQAQQSGMIEHAENDMGTVATFTAVDPEGVAPIVWSVDPADFPDRPIDVNGDGDTNDDVDVVADDMEDNARFKISNAGVLTFKEAPNFEAEKRRQQRR